MVWVGLDDNRPLGLSGTMAALPIWTAFMTRALSGHTSLAFSAPDGVTFAEIDPDTGYLAGPKLSAVAKRSLPPRHRPGRRFAPITGIELTDSTRRAPAVFA